jgi:plastocyanin
MEGLAFVPVRRLLVLFAAVLVLSAAPARAAETTIEVGDDFFNPANVQIAVGDTVKWVWAANSAGDHNVSTKANQAEKFDSDPGKPEPLISHPPGYTYSYTFNKDGVAVDYVCRVHPITMQGTVTVGVPPADTGAPLVSRAKATVGKKKITVAFELDEDAKVELKIAKASKPKKTLRSVRKSLDAGKQKIAVRRKGLPPGRYKVSITAKDEAGNKSRAARAGFKIKPS